MQLARGRSGTPAQGRRLAEARSLIGGMKVPAAPVAEVIDGVEPWPASCYLRAGWEPPSPARTILEGPLGIGGVGVGVGVCVPRFAGAPVSAPPGDAHQAAPRDGFLRGLARAAYAPVSGSCPRRCPGSAPGRGARPMIAPWSRAAAEVLERVLRGLCWRRLRRVGCGVRRPVGVFGSRQRGRARGNARDAEARAEARRGGTQRRPINFGGRAASSSVAAWGCGDRLRGGDASRRRLQRRKPRKDAPRRVR